MSDPELELDWSMGFELPTVFSATSLLSATSLVFRKHVPNGVLTRGHALWQHHPGQRPEPACHPVCRMSHGTDVSLHVKDILAD